MNSILRACGAAAAAIALAATATHADPSIAGQSDTVQPTATYLDHAAATIDGGEAVSDSALEPSTVIDETAGSDAASHSVANLVSDMVQAASAMMPGQSLDALVDAYAATETRDREQECLAGAVYFEAQGEPLEGQLAVAEVVINRAASGRYPASLCDVITQRAQFSFIQKGRFPPIRRTSVAWQKAVAIATIAQDKLIERVPGDVLWYHADYVAPIWRHGLTRVTKIGAHIFYS